jgi:hypothetical protein
MQTITPACISKNKFDMFTTTGTQKVITTMPLPPYSRHYLPSHHTNAGQGSSRRYGDELDWLDNPFRSMSSTMAFLGLCTFVFVSSYVLVQKYCQIRSYKSFSSNARPARNLESAQALPSDVDTDRLWMSQTVSEGATADLIGMQEGAICHDRKASLFTGFPYEARDSDDGHAAHHDLEGAMQRRALPDEIAQEEYFTPASAALNSNKAFWTKQKQSGEELDQVRRNLRSKVIRANGVTVGQVCDSAIAQRRRSTSNRSM